MVEKIDNVSATERIEPELSKYADQVASQADLLTNVNPLMESKETTPPPSFEEIVEELKTNFPEIPDDLTNKRVNILVELPNQPKISIALYKGKFVSISNGEYTANIDSNGSNSLDRTYTETNYKNWQYQHNFKTSYEEFNEDTNGLILKAINNPQYSTIKITDLEE